MPVRERVVLPGVREREMTGWGAGGALPGAFGVERADLSAGSAGIGSAEGGTEVGGTSMETGEAVRRAGGADAGLRRDRGTKATWRSLTVWQSSRAERLLVKTCKAYPDAKSVTTSQYLTFERDF
jgi:hypothetical protein